MSYTNQQYCRRRKENTYNEELGYIVAIILMIVAMPVAGLYLLFTGKDNTQKMFGVILTVLGIIVWVGLR